MSFNWLADTLANFCTIAPVNVANNNPQEQQSDDTSTPKQQSTMASTSEKEPLPAKPRFGRPDFGLFELVPGAHVLVEFEFDKCKKYTRACVVATVPDEDGDVSVIRLRCADEDRRFFYVDTHVRPMLGEPNLENTEVPPNNLLLDSAPNLGPLISCWEITVTSSTIADTKVSGF